MCRLQKIFCCGSFLLKILISSHFSTCDARDETIEEEHIKVPVMKIVNGDLSSKESAIREKWFLSLFAYGARI